MMKEQTLMELTIDRLSKQFGSKIAVDRVSATQMCIRDSA